VQTVDFYFSVASRYSYLASTQLDAVAARTGCRFVWKPLNNNDIMVGAGANPFRAQRPPSGQYDWSYREYDAGCWADYYGVPFVEPVNFRRDPPYLVRALCAAERCDALVPMARRLFRAIFVESVVIEEDMLANLAAQAGVDAFEAAFAAPATAARQQDLLDEAAGRGVFGVPTFCLGERLFWGNDRLVLVEHALTRTGSG
jgi:2-hydroxychromene-2-carboxylate isomerase